jgi:thiamine biosynthesis lipoprotein ApbE
VIVVAPSATTADAVATVLTILPINEGYEFVGALNAPGSAVGGAANTAMTVGPVRCWWFDESGRDLGSAGT